MKMPRHYRPEQLVSRKMDRFNLTDPYLDVEQQKLVATDGFRLVAVPVEIDEGDVSGYVSRELLQVGRRKSAKGEPVHIEKRIDLLPHRIEWPTEEGRKFPDWRSVVPTYRQGSEGTITIGLNTRLLKGISDALGSDGMVALTVRVSEVGTSPIVVRALEGDRKEVGILMPCHVGADGKAEKAAPVVDLPPTAAELKKAKEARGEDPDEPESMDLPGVPPGTPPNAVLRWVDQGEGMQVASVPTGQYVLRHGNDGLDPTWEPWSGKGKVLGRGLGLEEAKETCQRHNVERFADALVGSEMSKAALKGDAVARKKGRRK